MKKLSNIQKIIILLTIPTLFFGSYQYLLELEYTSKIENDLSLIDFKNDPSLYWSIDKWMYWLCWLFMLVVAFILFKKKKD